VSDNATTADRYRQKADESVTLAKEAISNEVRALHYAMAERYLRLAEDEMKRNAAKPTPGRLRARVPRRHRGEGRLADASPPIYDKTG